jgi:hypothetical protein
MATSDPNTDEPGRAAWRVIEPYLDAVEIHDAPERFLRDLAPLPITAQHLFAVSWCDQEICNGGLYQFFSNSTGVLAPEAMAGYRAVGLVDCANMVQAAFDQFHPSYPRGRSERQAILQALMLPGKTRKEWDPFCNFDRQYYVAKDRADFENALDRFAARNAR